MADSNCCPCEFSLRGSWYSSGSIKQVLMRSASHRAVTDLVASEETVTVSQCGFFGFDVFLFQFAPVAANMSAKQSQTVELVGGD